MEEAKGKKIIIVDDDKFLVDMYSLKFKNAGVDVDYAFSGEELLSKLKSGDKVDLILLDIVMPNMDGIATLEAVRKDKLAGEAKIIMLTNQNDSTDIDRAKEIGVDGYIIKATATPSEVVEQSMKVINIK